ncbi:MAG TPA: SDR family NAD(P)-dependent oxidoreductase [Gammaproteobacteria bacterium]|nr:SDR family NAD(P)-dependent oxidoreductase [Gammaproteobacteria bacterium]
MSEQKVAVVLGVGPGLGRAVARRFAAGGYAVGLMARGEDKLEPVQREIEGGGGKAVSIPCDVTDPASVAAGFEQLRRALGDPHVYIHNAGAFHMGRLLEVSPEQFEQCWKANCYGGFLGAQQALPAMLTRGAGTVILTGATAALRGAAGFSCLAVGKFGLRAVAQCLAREYGPQGIHVAHVVLDGQIDTPKLRRRDPDRARETLLDPQAIAETYWQLHAQAPSAWTLELDLRPAVEKF